MGHERQEIECKIVCPNVNFYGVALVMFSKGSNPLKKSLAAGMEEHVVMELEGMKQEQKKVLFILH